MAESLLNDRVLIPRIYLQTRQAVLFDSFEFKRKNNLVIFFLTSTDFDFLIKIEEKIKDFKEQNAEIIFIFPFSLSRIEEICKTHRFSFWVLADPNRDVFNKFIRIKPEEKAAGLFITDKFGELFFQYVESCSEWLPPVEDILKSLLFIESQCPECGGGD